MKTITVKDRNGNESQMEVGDDIDRKRLKNVEEELKYQIEKYSAHRDIAVELLKKNEKLSDEYWNRIGSYKSVEELKKDNSDLIKDWWK